MEMKKKLVFQFNWSSLLLTCRRKKKMKCSDKVTLTFHLTHCIQSFILICNKKLNEETILIPNKQSPLK